MRLLFLTPQLPYPPHQGTILRNFNIIKQLAARHEIHLLSFGTPEELNDSPLREFCTRIEIAADASARTTRKRGSMRADASPPPTRSTLQRALETFFHPLPDMARRLHSPELAAKLAARLRENEYAVVQIEGIEMASAWLEFNVPSPVTRHPSLVFDDHNAEWALQKTAHDTDARNPRRWHGALYSWIQYNKLKRFERQICLAANAVVAVSPQDAEAIASLDPRIKPVVIPNGVDCEYYVPSDEVCAKPLAEFSIVFTGKMDFRPNIDACVWFADEILPRLRKELPLAHVSFVGQKPSAKVLALKERVGVAVTGLVPDTRPYIADAAVFAVPLRMGSGTRLKVLEAMAMGKAIVSTSFGVSGIACENGRDVLIADDAPSFARALAMLMRDKARARVLGMNARQVAEEKYEWKKLVPKFEEIYAQLRARARG
ncbi:MAG: glycosyltransferase [Chloroflexi bacterium]|nr:glycosyltransferase [Chloroflexota bacterium]